MTQRSTWKSLAFWALASCLIQPLWAQVGGVGADKPATSPNVDSDAAASTLGGGLSPTAERTRIQAERTKLEAIFSQAQAACYQKFAVENCQSDARLVRRENLADLRRQEVSLNAIEARQKGAAQLSRVDSKLSIQAEQDGAAQRAVALEKQQARLANADEKAAGRAPAIAGAGVGSATSTDVLTRAEKKAQTQVDSVTKARAGVLQQKKYEEKLKQAKLKTEQRRKRLTTGPVAPASLSQ